MQRKWLISFWILTIGLSLLLHARIFSLDLMGPHVWRQTQTQSYTKNMVSGEGSLFHPVVNNLGLGNQGYLPMEFPLLQWVTAQAIKATGWNDVAVVRWISFLIGLAGIAGMFFLVKWLTYSVKAGLLVAWTFTWSPVFYYYTVNPLPDVLALALGIWGLALTIRWHQSNSWIHGLIASVFICIAALIKLPFIVFGAGLVVTWIILWRSGKWALGYGLGMGALLALPLLAPAGWYLTVLPQWGSNGVVTGILDNQRTLGNLLFVLQGHLISTLPELLLNYGATLFFIIGVVLLFRKRNYWSDGRVQILASSGLAVLAYFFFELNMIGLEHDYYLLPFLPLLFVLVVHGARWMMRHERQWLRGLAWLALAILPLLAFLRIDSRWNPENPGFNKTLLTHQSELQGLIPKDAIVVAGPDNSAHIWLYYLDRNGYTFDERGLSEEMLRRWENLGASFLIIEDSPKNPYAGPLPAHSPVKIGSLRLFRLE